MFALFTEEQVEEYKRHHETMREWKDAYERKP